jgi:hypothetical protein
VAWTYYLETHANGDWSLYRESEALPSASRREECFHRSDGWKSSLGTSVDSDSLLRKRMRGDIAGTDVISEDAAMKLVAGAK